MNRDHIKGFFDAWDLYDRVLDHNYMFHDELYASLATALDARFVNRPFSILDLGCGSARHLARTLVPHTITRYTGCDISDVALAHARRNLAPLDCPVELNQTDLLQGILQGDTRYDVIFSSYALHHLDTAAKAQFFQHARNRLAPGGILVLIDIAREEHQDLAAYLDAYCGWIQADWDALPQNGLDYIFDHIRNNDYPESPSALKAMAQSAGFTRSETLQSARWHHLWTFE
ncbi:MAG: class I SAM-dependent methyltransferase [Candidatus Sumerlaeaceae bacterium]|nr:class I SAM-dependent methyltransferase [Candidatus Sumerlaeaceae bacterium]